MSLPKRIYQGKMLRIFEAEENEEKLEEVD